MAEDAYVRGKANANANAIGTANTNVNVNANTAAKANASANVNANANANAIANGDTNANANDNGNANAIAKGDINANDDTNANANANANAIGNAVVVVAEAEVGGEGMPDTGIAPEPTMDQPTLADVQEEVRALMGMTHACQEQVRSLGASLGVFAAECTAPFDARFKTSIRA